MFGSLEELKNKEKIQKNIEKKQEPWKEEVKNDTDELMDIDVLEGGGGGIDCKKTSNDEKNECQKKNNSQNLNNNDKSDLNVKSQNGDDDIREGTMANGENVVKNNKNNDDDDDDASMEISVNDVSDGEKNINKVEKEENVNKNTTEETDDVRRMGLG